MSKIADIVMSKEHSPHEVRITTDPEDDHFCNIAVMRKRDGSTACQHYILTSDVPTWIGYYEGDGFTLKEDRA